MHLRRVRAEDRWRRDSVHPKPDSQSSMPSRLFRYQHLGVFMMSVTQPCRHLQSCLESQEGSEPTSCLRAREMQKTGVLQSLSPADPGQAGVAKARLSVPWNTARKQMGYVLPMSGSKSTQVGDGRFGKLSSPFFFHDTCGADWQEELQSLRDLPYHQPYRMISLGCL